MDSLSNYQGLISAVGEVNKIKSDELSEKKEEAKANPGVVDLIIKATVPTSGSFSLTTTIKFELTRNCEIGVFNNVSPNDPINSIAPIPVPIPTGIPTVL